MSVGRRRLGDTLLIVRWVVAALTFAVVVAHQLVQLVFFEVLDSSVLLVSNVLIYGISGPVIAWLALTWLARNVAERERVQEEVRKREQFLASITTASADAILSLDLNGIIQSWSRGAEHIFGYTSEEVVGRHFRIIVPEDLQAQGEIEKLARMTQEHGYVRNYETERITRSGRRVIVDLTRTTITDSEGAVIGYSAVIRDVTARKRAEMEIRKLNRELEERVAQRTQELEQAYEELRKRNAALERANRELQELDRLKSDFISMVSHELRAPLTNMNGALELMRAECASDADPAVRSLLDVITEQSGRLTRFVQSVLNVSRIEAGGIALHLGPVEISQLLGSVVADFTGRSLPHGIHVSVEEKPLFAWADRDRLHEVLVNLLDNAVKYSPHGGDIRLEARLAEDVTTLRPGSTLPAGSYVLVSVSDQGLGIPEDQQERIFERFYRVDSNDSREVYGHGLGLYIARRLVEAQGGAIWVESRPGKGSHFFFVVPQAVRHEQEGHDGQNPGD